MPLLLGRVVPTGSQGLLVWSWNFPSPRAQPTLRGPHCPSLCPGQLREEGARFLSGHGFPWVAHRPHPDEALLTALLSPELLPRRLERLRLCHRAGKYHGHFGHGDRGKYPPVPRAAGCSPRAELGAGVTPASTGSGLRNRPPNGFRWRLRSHQLDESPDLWVSDARPSTPEPGRAQAVESPGVLSVGNEAMALLTRGLCPALPVWVAR